MQKFSTIDSTVNSNSNLPKVNNSNSILDQEQHTVSVRQVISNLPDVIPQDDYMPFYVSQYKKLGYKRFMELVGKARAGGKDPKRLFFWMLQNNELVR